MLRTPMIFIVCCLLSLGVGCPAAECEDDEQQCSGDQIQTCVDGQWGDAEDCATAGETCMTMEDTGMQHCMATM